MVKSLNNENLKDTSAERMLLLGLIVATMCMYAFNCYKMVLHKLQLWCAQIVVLKRYISDAAFNIEFIFPKFIQTGNKSSQCRTQGTTDSDNLRVQAKS